MTSSSDAAAYLAAATEGDAVTTPVFTTESLLERAWQVHSDSEKLITQHSLRLLAGILKGVVTDHVNHGVPTGRVRLTWEETPGWDIEVMLQGATVWLEVGEVDEGITDDLAEYTAHIWETSPSLLERYTEDGTVETDRTFYMLDKAVFQMDRMVLGPRGDADQDALFRAASGQE